jgi:dimethylargininase
MLIAVTREVSRSLESCELTHLPRTFIDLRLARLQHGLYCDALRRLGCEVMSLPASDDYPDAVFVEDAAVVLDEIAIITRPGAESRRGETASIAEALGARRTILQIHEPGILDGGDVLRLGRRIFVGLSGRSNAAGIAQLAAMVTPHGYTVTTATVSGCLHLKSAATEAAPGVVLLNPAWVDPSLFGGVDIIETDAAEPYAANALLICDESDRHEPGMDRASRAAAGTDGTAPVGSRRAGVAIYPSSFPRTRRRLEARGVSLELVDVSELMKAEGAVTCCSLVFKA